MGQQKSGRVTKEGLVMNERTSRSGVMMMVEQADAAAPLLPRTRQAPGGANLVSAKAPNRAH